MFPVAIEVLSHHTAVISFTLVRRKIYGYVPLVILKIHYSSSREYNKKAKEAKVLLKTDQHTTLQCHAQTIKIAIPTDYIILHIIYHYDIQFLYLDFNAGVRYICGTENTSWPKKTPEEHHKMFIKISIMII